MSVPPVAGGAESPTEVLVAGGPTRRRRRRGRILVMQRVLGAIFLLAGVLKFSPVPEDVPLSLRQMALANAGTWLAPASEWCASHPFVIQVIVGVGMTAAGLVYLLDRGPVRAAAIGLSTMLLCFIVFLWRWRGALVAPSDTALIVMNVLIYLDRAERQREARLGS